ncbi:S100 calcium binding protein V1 [Myripristis murdjan]|uniref:S100 calcium binding protein V1 n=1 Tax=Myripristis murdjan TaxID=586833 RepID=UPI0011760EA1|nr:protein S100-A10-like [Myripristis murdjan]
MATKYSDLELAINTLVTEFHSAADDKPTMSSSQFQTMMSKQLPSFAETLDSEDGLSQVLQHMGVQSGQSISFENFWTLVQQLAGQQFQLLHKDKSVKCSCLLQ